MNPNGIVKQYDRLTPRERFPLILAAVARGDDQEADRLGKSAPRVVWSFANHAGRAFAFVEVSNLHFMELLDQAAVCFQTAFTFQTVRLSKERAIEGKKAEPIGDRFRFHGFLFKVQLDGWRLFCREEGLPPESFWSFLPGNGTLRIAEELAQKTAFDAEEAQAFVTRGGLDGTPKGPGAVVILPTPEAVAADLRKCFETRAEYWS